MWNFHVVGVSCVRVKVSMVQPLCAPHAIFDMGENAYPDDNTLLRKISTNALKFSRRTRMPADMPEGV